MLSLLKHILIKLLVIGGILVAMVGTVALGATWANHIEAAGYGIFWQCLAFFAPCVIVGSVFYGFAEWFYEI